MTLMIPDYIKKAEIQDVSIKYKWDDWDVQSTFMLDDDEFRKRMSKLSHRANAAFTVACGEWLIHRFDLVSDDQIPHHHMEASWAGIIDPVYIIYWEPPDKLWLGPIRGALQLAIIFTLEAINAAFDYADPAQRADYAWNLARHIMADPKPLLDWKKRIVKRLEYLYPLDEGDPLGDVVPREAMDPDFDFQPEMTEQLVQSFLSKLNPNMNPKLKTQEQMVKCRFKGTPYRFDMQEDRIARNDF